MRAHQGNICVPSDPDPPAFASAEFFDFDVAAVGLGFHHFDDPALAARRLAARLKTGGVLVILDFLPHGELNVSQSSFVLSVAASGGQLTDFFFSFFPRVTAALARRFVHRHPPRLLCGADPAYLRRGWGGEGFCAGGGRGGVLSRHGGQAGGEEEDLHCSGDQGLICDGMGQVLLRMWTGEGLVFQGFWPFSYTVVVI